MTNAMVVPWHRPKSRFLPALPITPPCHSTLRNHCSSQLLDVCLKNTQVKPPTLLSFQ